MYTLAESAYGDWGVYRIGQGPAIDQVWANNTRHNIYSTEIRGNQMINFVIEWLLDLHIGIEKWCYVSFLKDK